MKKHIYLGAVFALIAVVAAAGVDTNLTLRGVRDPVQLRQTLNDNFAYLNNGVGTGSVERLALSLTNVAITAAAPVTNVTGLAAFATNIVAVAPATNIVVTETVYTLNYLDTNSAPAVLVFTTRTYAVQSGDAPTLQTVTPAVQRGTAPSLTLQR